MAVAIAALAVAAPAAVPSRGVEGGAGWVDGPDRPKLRGGVVAADAPRVRSATTVDAEVIAAAPRLKIIARAGVGLDNVDVDAATAAGVLVVNAPTSNIHSAAEHAIALMLAAARQIPDADAPLPSVSYTTPTLPPNRECVCLPGRVATKTIHN